MSFNNSIRLDPTESFHASCKNLVLNLEVRRLQVIKPILQKLWVYNCQLTLQTITSGSSLISHYPLYFKVFKFPLSDSIYLDGKVWKTRFSSMFFPLYIYTPLLCWVLTEIGDLLSNTSSTLLD